VRLFVLTSVAIAGLAAPASACPPLDACLVKLPSTVKLTPRADGQATAVKLPALDLARAVRTVRKLAPGEIEMPWIWRVLRDQVYSRMPTYEERNELKIVLSPVVVSSPTDTVPGVGIAGDF
jgi:hypothetical protein